MNITSIKNSMMALAVFAMSITMALAGDGVTCKIGDQEFTSITQAISAVPHDKTPVTITMVADEVDTTETIIKIQRGSELTIDLNGKEIHSTGAYSYIQVDNGASLTMIDSEGNGRWTVDRCHLFTNQGKLIIKGGTYEDMTDVIDFSVGLIDTNKDLTIDGGHFIQHTNMPVLYCYDGMTEINGGTLEHKGVADPENWDTMHAVCTSTYSTAKLVINGGVFKTQGNTQLLYCDCATEIHGGEFHSGTHEHSYTLAVGNGNSQRVVVYDGKFYGKGNNCTVYNMSTGPGLLVYGGYFENQNGRPVVYGYENSTTILAGGEFNLMNNKWDEAPVYSQPSSTMALHGGLFSEYPLKFSTAYGFVEINTDPATANTYPFKGAGTDLEVEEVKEVWLKNVATGQYIGIGDNNNGGAQFKGSDVGTRFFMYKLKGNYAVFTTLISSNTALWIMAISGGKSIVGDCFGPAREGMYHDGISAYSPLRNQMGNLGPRFAQCLAELTEVEPGIFEIKFVGNNNLWLDSHDDVIYSDYYNSSDYTDRYYQWKIETKEDIISAMKAAEDTVNVSSLIKAADFAAKDLESNIDFSIYIDENQQFLLGDNPYWQGITADVKHTTYTAKDGKHMSGLMEVSAKKFNVFQTITGLPNGEYIVQCNGLYRNGLSALSVASKRDKGTEALNAKFYANDVEQPLKGLLDGAVAEKVDGLGSSKYGYVPKDVAGALMQFEKGLYVNRIKVKVTDGTLTFGVKMQEAVTSGEWTVFDNFRLYYCGNSREAMPDVNGDGNVDTQDVLCIYSFIQYGVGIKNEDINKDGHVDTQDVLSTYEYMMSHAKERKDISEE